MNTTASQIRWKHIKSHGCRRSHRTIHIEQASFDLNICVNPTALHNDNGKNQIMHSLSDTDALVSSSLSVSADDNPVSKQNEMHYVNKARQSNMNAELCPNKPTKTNEVSIQNTPSYSQENLSQTSDINFQTCNSATRGQSRSSRANARSEKRSESARPNGRNKSVSKNISRNYFSQTLDRPLNDVWVSQDSIKRTISDVTVQSDNQVASK